MLNQHPEVHCAGELFNPASIIPIYDLNKCFARYLPHGPVVRGFTLQGINGEANDSREEWRKWSFIWRELPKRVTHVLRLDRKDELARAVSLHIALQRWLWVVPKGKTAPEVPPFYFEPKEMIRQVLRLRQTAEDHFPAFNRTGISHLSIEYEDLWHHPQKTMHQVFEFLGVPKRPVQPDQQKIGKPLEQQLLNYEEVLQAYRTLPSTSKTSAPNTTSP